MKTNLLIGAGVIVILSIVAWFIFFSRPSQPAVPAQNTFQQGTSRVTTVGVGVTNDTNQPLSAGGTGTGATQTIFKIDNGPVVAAVFIQTSHPTTTIARYVMQENAHVFDLALDSPGAVARSTSNTTVPGIAQAQWAQGGQTVLLQYLDGSIVKTLSLTLPPVSTSSIRVAPKMRFLPDGITGAAFSPDGKSIAYLLKGAAGADGYTAAADGSNPKKLFSLPLSQLILSWPSPSTILLYTKSSVGLQGVLFSVATNSGAVTPLLYAQGITAIANRVFSYILYQTADTQQVATYARDSKTGFNISVSFDPYPEKCVWSSVATFALYCASPIQYDGTGYLDARHIGTKSAPDNILGYNLLTKQSVVMAIPGSKDGGVASDILSLSVSPGDKYLMFIKKDDRSLWGVRLVR